MKNFYEYSLIACITVCLYVKIKANSKDQAHKNTPIEEYYMEYPSGAERKRCYCYKVAAPNRVGQYQYIYSDSILKHNIIAHKEYVPCQ